MICDCAGSLAVPPLSTHQNLKSHKNMLRNRTLFPKKKSDTKFLIWRFSTQEAWKFSGRSNSGSGGKLGGCQLSEGQASQAPPGGDHLVVLFSGCTTTPGE